MKKRLLLFAAMVLHCTLFAQSSYSTDLRIGTPVQAKITPQMTDLYLVQLSKGQFASIRVHQRNAEVLALVYDPQDSLIYIVDDGGPGQDEVVTIQAPLTGKYKVKLLWAFKRPLTGDYTITLERVERTGPTVAQKAKQLMDSWYKKDGPGASVAVVQNGKIVFKYSRGLGNLEEGAPLSSSSVFELASCSKQFTAFAIAMLVDKGLISMADDIRRYIPEMHDFGEKITVANLVYHTSGIRSTDVLELAGHTPEDILTLPMTIQLATRQQQLKFKPGERYHYSNTNYNLLAEIVARVTGQSFSTWTKENIFLPLGMNSTFFKEDPGFLYAHKVLCYKPEGDGFRQRNNNYAAAGAASLCSSLDDLVKWVNSFGTKKLISPQMDSLLQSTGTLNNGKKTNYAFGNNLGMYQGLNSIEHLGLVIGYRTAIVRFPGKKLDLIYLSNDDNDASYRRFYLMRDLFLGIPENKPSLQGMPKVADVLAKFEKDDSAGYAENLAEYTGSYFSEELQLPLHLTVKNKRLLITYSHLPDKLLNRTSGDEFEFIRFERDAKQRVIGLSIPGEKLFFGRIENNVLPK